MSSAEKIVYSVFEKLVHFVCTFLTKKKSSRKLSFFTEISIQRGEFLIMNTVDNKNVYNNNSPTLMLQNV